MGMWWRGVIRLAGTEVLIKFYKNFAGRLLCVMLLCIWYNSFVVGLTLSRCGLRWLVGV